MYRLQQVLSQRFHGKPLQTERTIDKQHQKYAVFAEAAYNPENKNPYTNYQRNDELSDDYVSVYESKEDIILSIRGARPTDSTDLVSIASLMHGGLKKTYRYQHAERVLEKTTQHYANDERRMIMTGHSLGGSITQVLKAEKEEIDEAYAFNPGTSPLGYVHEKHRRNPIIGGYLLTHLFNNMGLFDAQPDTDSHSIYILGDPISAVGTFNPNATVYDAREDLNAHTINQFID